MKALVVYESMFGNTREVADRIADGLRPGLDVTVMPVGAASADVVAGADVLVVGGPTHVHGMPSDRTRKMAKTMADKEGSELVLEPRALEPGLREWLRTLHVRPGVVAAAFDTRAHGPAVFTGRASRRIARRLRRQGVQVRETASFFVDKNGRLCGGEAERAQAWGAALLHELRGEMGAMTPVSPPSSQQG